MSAYDAGEWADVFVAAAGASAALAGLVFVAVSINIERIIAIEGMPDRALQALLQLLAVVVFSLLVLAPGQSNVALGIELAAVGVVLTVGSLWLLNRALSASDAPPPHSRRVVVGAGTVPFVVAGVSLIVEAGGGIYWVLAGAITALLGGVLNAWVLLVEIRR